MTPSSMYIYYFSKKNMSKRQVVLGFVIQQQTVHSEYTPTIRGSNGRDGDKIFLLSNQLNFSVQFICY